MCLDVVCVEGVFSQIRSHICTLIGKVLQANFKAVGRTHIELDILKIEKLDVYVRPFLQIQTHITVIVTMMLVGYYFIIIIYYYQFLSGTWVAQKAGPANVLPRVQKHIHIQVAITTYIHTL